MNEDQDQTEHTEADTDTPELQARARDMGWKPESEWKGKPPRDGFLDAPEYVRRAEKVMPIVRAENAKLKDEVSKLRGELELTRTEQRQTVARIEKMSTLALQQQREQIEAGYAARKEAAVEVGDKEAYKQIVKDEREATKALDERLKENTSKDDDKDAGKKPGDMPKHIQDTIDSWKADNAWYSDDPTDEMTAYANALHMKLQREKKGLTLKENLEEVADRVRKRFPEEFGGADKGDDDEPEEKPRGSRVEGGSRNGGSGSKSAWSKVPADARKVAEDAGHLEYFLKSGETLEKNMPQARERWAAKYLEGDAR